MTKDDFLGPSCDSNLPKRKRDNVMESQEDGDSEDCICMEPQEDGDSEHCLEPQEHGNSEDCADCGSDDDCYMDNIPSYDVEAAFDDLPSGVEAIVPWMLKLNSETTAPEVPDEYDMFLKSFKKFDTIEGCPDHYFLKSKRFGAKVWSGVGGDFTKKMPIELAKKIQHEWSLLESGLPEMIFVRACEDRMDFLRAVIIGPSGTPYQDGLFFFDICFPERYPSKPPLVYYHSHGLRLNPNLYEDGTVCLSLLNTWDGTGCEVWTPDSTMLQVLLSIQAIVLNEKPYYNEPGYERYANTPEGELNSLKYNGLAYLDSCRTMLYLLRKPPPNFEDFVLAYFRKAGKAILLNLRGYMHDERISSLSDDVGRDSFHGSYPIHPIIGDDSNVSTKLRFKAKLQKLYYDILMELTVKGADCGELHSPKTSGGPAGTSASAVAASN